MDPDRKGDVTLLLEEASQGSADALARLFPLVYDELRRLASRQIDREGAAHTLQPTALVHEAYLRLVRQRTAGFRDRAQFFGVAAQAMRRILVDHARAKKRAKRSSGGAKEPLDAALALFEERAIDLVALDEALSELERLDPRKVRLVELRFHGGLEMREAAEMLGVPLRTAERDWTMTRAFLRSRIGDVIGSG